MTLPNGWQHAPIGSLCDLVNGRPFKPSEWSKDGLPIIRIQNLNRRDSPFNYYSGHIDERYIVRNGDLLFAWSGTPGTSFGAHIWNGSLALLNQHIFSVQFDKTIIDRNYFKFAINRTLEELIRKAHGGVGLAHITKQTLQSTNIILPPLAEQRRIVTKIFEIETKLSKGRRNLRQIPIIARSLRAAAVRRAYTGELTNYWRSDIDLSDSAGRWALPGSWGWRTLGQIADIRSGITLGRRYPPDTPLLERPYLRVANVQRGRLDLSQIKTIKVNAKEADQLSLRLGDILMNEGGDRDKLGRGWVWDGQIPECIHQNHVFRVRLKSSNDVSKYVSYYANEFGQDFFFEQGTQTTNLASISKAKLSELPVPLAPPDEQAEIVRRLDDLFARADRLEAEANRALALLDRLESAILDKAFRGELVPQDPNDEPASVMLERIRAERATEKPARRRRATTAPAG